MQYDTPEGFATWPLECRVEWHRERVDREAPIYEMLEKAEIMTCFNVTELQNRLFRVRWWRNLVESELRLLESDEFQGLKRDLQEAENRVRYYVRERAMLLRESFKKSSKGFLNTALMASLKESQCAAFNHVLEIETQLCDCCKSLGASVENHLVSENLKSLM